MTMTRRKEIIDLLRVQPMTVRELALHFNADAKEVAVDLEHIARSVKPRERLKMEPAACRNCGFVFKAREKFKKPSRCPDCKREKIAEPIFSVQAA